MRVSQIFNFFPCLRASDCAMGAGLWALKPSNPKKPTLAGFSFYLIENQGLFIPDKQDRDENFSNIRLFSMPACAGMCHGCWSLGSAVSK